MFVSAIETAGQFTRPIHSIIRYWGSTTVVPGAATLFFVNADGWALTCGHVVRMLAEGDALLTKFTKFKTERSALPTGPNRKQALRTLEKRYSYADKQLVELYHRFVDCIDGPIDIEAQLHPSVDVALLRFRNFTRLHCTSFPVFARQGSDLKQGKFLCRLGYPFPEFTSFEYDLDADQIRWTATGKSVTPRFPIEGMVSRHLLDANGSIVGFEMSTPGLRGQSGGPAFDVDARVWGVQASTNHLDLDFDVDMDVLRAGKKKRVQDSAFLHVGNCVHVDILKSFMRDKGVQFREG
jgi:hypothetical protein